MVKSLGPLDLRILGLRQLQTCSIRSAGKSYVGDMDIWIQDTHSA